MATPITELSSRCKCTRASEAPATPARARSTWARMARARRPVTRAGRHAEAHTSRPSAATASGSARTHVIGDARPRALRHVCKLTARSNSCATRGTCLCKRMFCTRGSPCHDNPCRTLPFPATRQPAVGPRAASLHAETCCALPSSGACEHVCCHGRTQVSASLTSGERRPRSAGEARTPRASSSL